MAVLLIGVLICGDDLPVAVWPAVIVASARRVVKTLHEVKALHRAPGRSCRLPRTPLSSGGAEHGWRWCVTLVVRDVYDTEMIMALTRPQRSVAIW